MRLRELVGDLGGVLVAEVDLRLVRLGGAEGAGVEGGDGTGFVEVHLEEVRRGVLQGEGHLGVADAEDAVPREKELRLGLAEGTGGDEDELLELAAGLDVGVLVAELDALAEEATASFDVRVGGVGIVEAELRAEVAQGLRLPTLHGRVTHGNDGHEVGVVELGHRLGALLRHVVHPKLGADRADISLGDGGGIAVDHAVPQRLGRGGDALLVRGGDTGGGGGAETGGEDRLAGVAANLATDEGAGGKATTDNRGVGCDARAAERRLLLLELVHVLLELVGGRAALRERREWMAGEGQREGINRRDRSDLRSRPSRGGVGRA